MSFIFPIFSVNLAIILAYVPHFIRVVYLTRKAKYDNKAPRAAAKDQDEFAQRLLGAHNNQLEMLGVYAAGIVANVARGKTGTRLNALAGIYIGLRALYVAVYAAPPFLGGYLRTAAFASCMAVNIVIWVSASV